jgi:(p)ppGpp synthase/HD superfamily hydrolase
MENRLEKEIAFSRLEKAIDFAVQAHRGQTDKVGLPYILHPLAVMFYGKCESERIVGVLHDVVEDTPYGINDLNEMVSLTSEEEIALIALTHLKNEPYIDYIKRIANSNRLAIEVKLNDLFHNMSEERMMGLDEQTQVRLKKKYDIAWSMLYSPGWPFILSTIQP